MKSLHNPRINVRYWAAIALASVFGTNLGDLYAHELHLGITKGLVVLAIFAAIVFFAERFDNHARELYYWTVIIIIRTGATNIADYLLYRVRVGELKLTLILAALIFLFALGTHRKAKSGNAAPALLPSTNTAYWLAMLSAGVFGTVVGDICEHAFGDGAAAASLSILLLVVLLISRRAATDFVAVYWLVVATARTTGTAVGDWFAENKVLHIGLPLCTLLSGLIFLAILMLWRQPQTQLADGVA